MVAYLWAAAIVSGVRRWDSRPTGSMTADRVGSRVRRWLPPGAVPELDRSSRHRVLGPTADARSGLRRCVPLTSSPRGAERRRRENGFDVGCAGSCLPVGLRADDGVDRREVAACPREGFRADGSWQAVGGALVGRWVRPCGNRCGRRRCLRPGRSAGAMGGELLPKRRPVAVPPRPLVRPHPPVARKMADGIRRDRRNVRGPGRSPPPAARSTVSCPHPAFTHRRTVGHQGTRGVSRTASARWTRQVFRPSAM